MNITKTFIYDATETLWSDRYLWNINFKLIISDYQQYMYDFGAKYFSYIDIDKSGTLSKTEFEYLLAGAAAVDARVILVAFDADGNGLLTEPELGNDFQ